MDHIIQTLLFTVSLILLTINSVQSAANKIQENCVPDGENGDHCYTLYGSPSASYTWSQAVDECSDMGQALLTIQDAQEQSNITDLLDRAERQEGTVHVWIAGRINQDQNLTYVNGDPVGSEITLVNSTGECGARNPQGLFATQCQSGYYDGALCQYDADSCKSGQFASDVRYAGHCYHIYQTPHIVMDWIEARQYCRDYESGDLAYSSLGDSGLWQEVILGTDYLNVWRTDNLYVWVGFTSRHYVWVQGTTETPMSFTNFRRRGGSEKCVHLDPKANFDKDKWITKFCALNSRYFICETNGVIKSSTSESSAQSSAQSPTEPTAQSTAQPTAQITAQPTAKPTANPELTTKPSQNSTQNPGEQTAEEPSLTKGQMVGLSVGLVLGVLILTVTVLVVTIFVRRKNQKPTSTAELQSTVATPDFPLDENRTVTDQGPPLDENHTVTAQGPPLDENRTVTAQGSPLDENRTVTAQGSPLDDNRTVTDQGPPLDENCTVTTQGPPSDENLTVTAQGPPLDEENSYEEIPPLNIAPLNTAPPNTASLNTAPLNYKDLQWPTESTKMPGGAAHSSVLHK